MTMSRDRNYHQIVQLSEEWLKRYGDRPEGVGWPVAKDAPTRYRVMLELIRPEHRSGVRLLDFGCGLSHLYEYIRGEGIAGIEYSGLEISATYLEISRRKHPGVTYYDIDVLEDDAALPEFDYIVMNGIFTSRARMSREEMFGFVSSLVVRVFAHARHGIAFNVMSKQVEWEREDLFHLPIDPLADFLARNVSRHFVIRHDYGLYEYTTYVYRQATAPEQNHAKQLI
jgi:SAM-dependent methyltransferase